MLGRLGEEVYPLPLRLLIQTPFLLLGFNAGMHSYWSVRVKLTQDGL